MLHDLQERKLRHFFDVFDSDHDGLLEQSDFETYLQRMSEATGHRKGWDELQSRWMFVWTTLQAMGDVDHDQMVSPDEWLSLADQLLQSEQSYAAIMNGIGETTFPRLDSDGDGYVSRDETMANLREFFYSDDPDAAGNLFFGPL